MIPLDKRQQALRARRGLSEQQIKEKSALVVQRLVPFVQGTIALYAPCDHEVDVMALQKDPSLTICLPVAYQDHTMNFFHYDENTTLKPSSFGILEPEGSQMVSSDSIDVIIIPMVAFDSHGHRLGHGAGYYDRYLSNAHGLKIGVAFACQEVSDIPSLPHDIDMDIMITEDHIYLQEFTHMLTYLNLLLQKGEDVVLAIDGNCGSGKSMLADYLEERLSCTRISMDDFFLPFDQRGTDSQESSIPNVDHLRLKKEVFEPLKRKQPISYQRYDCQTLTLLEAKPLAYQKLTIIEGSYSMHPFFQPYMTHSVFLSCARPIQKDRIKHRNPERYDAFIDRFIPMEDAYFSQFSIKEHCDILIDTSDSSK